MSNVIARLREDHRYMDRLLDILDREICILRNSGVSDLELVEDILAYNLAYPHLVHHPAEDTIFEKLRERGTITSQDLGDLPLEHRRLHQLTDRFAMAIRKVVLEQELPRDWLIEVATDYLTFARQHLQMEEAILFPLAESTLTAAEWAEVDQAIEGRSNAIDGTLVENRFLKLRQRILEWAGAA